MDISRPDIKKKKLRRNLIWAAMGVVVLAAAAVGVYRLKPAAPTVDASTIWPDTVKRGPMVRQVRGLGTLVPREDSIELIPAQTDATVVRIRVLPGTMVTPDTILMDLADPAASAEAAQCAAGTQGRGSRLQEPSGHAAKHPDGQEDRRGRRSTPTIPRTSCRRRPTSSFTIWA